MKSLDENGLLYFWQTIKGLFVRKVEGKGLSTNDYDATAKTKLDNLPAITSIGAGLSLLNGVLTSSATGGGITYSVVTVLPASGSASIIYLLSNGGTGNNAYDEYIWTGSAFEKIGTTEIDLSGYLQEGDITAITNAEIDTIIENAP